MQEYHVIATSVALWFNKYGDHDHDGLIYILAEYKDILSYIKRLQQENLKETGVDWDNLMTERKKLVEKYKFADSSRNEEWFPDTIPKAKKPHPLIVPLVLRVPLGSEISISLTNEIKDREVGIHLIGPGSDVMSDGSDISTNASSLVAYQQTKTFTWISKYEGVYVFHDSGDFRGDEKGTNVHGLFGALIVEPASSNWTDPETGDKLRSGLYADIHQQKHTNNVKPYPNYKNPASLTKEYADPEDSFREYVIFFHDEPHWEAPHGELPSNPCDEHHDPIQEAAGHTMGSLMPISYRAEPMISRERALWKMMNDGKIDPDNIVVNEEQHHSCWMFGEPATPVLKAYLGDPVRIRLVHAGVKETHVFHLHVYEWNAVPFHRESNIIDAITISPQTGHTIIPFYGAGNRQMVPGDIIWHCHLYPHFHHGMWGMFRTFDRLQNGEPGSYFNGDTGEPMTEDQYNALEEGRERNRYGRRLGFYPNMEPINRLVPLPDREPPPSQDLPNKQLGFPHFISGETGQKSFIPPWHKSKSAAAKEGWIVDDYDYREPTPLELNAFNVDPKPGELFTTFPHNDSAKSIHIDKHTGNRLKPSSTIELGVEVLMTPVKYNDYGWWDPHGHLYALKGHSIKTFSDVVHEKIHHTTKHLIDMEGMTEEDANARLMKEGIQIEPEPHDPLFFRCNKTNVMQLTFHNRLEKEIAATPFDSAWPKGAEKECTKFANYKAECGLHVHIVKFDPIACDGASTGWNYMSAPQVGKKMMYRWWADEEFGTIFTHDHLFANFRQKHGLFGALLVEPEIATFHDPKNNDTIIDGPEAVIRYKKDDVEMAYREFCLGNADWVPLFKLKPNIHDESNHVENDVHNNMDMKIDHGAEVEQDFVAHAPYLAHGTHSKINITYGQPIEPPNHPDSHDDNGVFGINYKCEPLAERKYDPSEWFNSKEFIVLPEHGQDELPITYGDPFTPIFHTIEGDPVRLRLVQGSHEEQHSFQVHGMRWKRFWKDAKSPIQNQQTLGLSEAFTFDIQPHYAAGDYLWKYSSAEDLWLGSWGFVRAFSSDATDRKKPLPLVPKLPLSPIVPLSKNKCRQFKVRAVPKTIEYRADLLDPFGLIYELTHVAKPNGTWEKVISSGNPEPLVLRCRQGEWIAVEVTNNLLDENIPEPMYPQLPHDDGERIVSNKVSLHADLLYYNVKTSDGSNVGNNPSTNISNKAGSNSHTYYWFADEALGAVPLQDMADIRNHRHHGLIGAVVVHPKKVTPYKVLPQSSTAVVTATNEQWYGTRVTLIDYNLFSKHSGFDRISEAAITEEQVLFLQDGLRYFLHGNYTMPIGDIPGDLPSERPDTEDQGLKGFNYRSEPSSHQRGYKSKPSTPEIRVLTNARVQIHLIGGCDKPRNHSFTIHGHFWREWPYLGNNSPQMSSQGGISSGFVKTFAFKANSRKGSYMYRSGVLKYVVEQGLWGILRVRPRHQIISGPAGITPALMVSGTLLGLFLRWLIVKKQEKNNG